MMKNILFSPHKKYKGLEMKSSKKKFIKALKENDLKTITKSLTAQPDLANLMLDEYIFDQNFYYNVSGWIDRITRGTPLIFAICHRNIQLIKLLLENQADPNIDASNSLSPLFIAVKLEFTPAIKLLLEQGAHVNYQDKRKRTPIFDAKKMSHIELLLDHGADINIADIDNETVFIDAIQFGSLAKATKLWDYHPNIDAKTTNGETAIFYAIETKKLTIIELLLTAGADLNIKNKFNKTPLFYFVEKCIKNCNINLFLKLLIKSDDINPADETSCVRDYIFSRKQKSPIIKSYYFGEVLLRRNLPLIIEIMHEHNYVINAEGCAVSDFVIVFRSFSLSAFINFFFRAFHLKSFIFFVRRKKNIFHHNHS